MLQRIRIACVNPYFINPLYDVVEIDETYIGGLEKNKHSNKKLRSGRGAVGKAPIVVIRSRKGIVNAFSVPVVNKRNLHKIINNYVVGGSKVYTDEHRGYTGISTKYKHETVKHKSGEYVRGDVHTNSVESYNARLNKAFYGTHSFFSRKFAFAYAAEIAFRQNKRSVNFGILVYCI